jgi:hypothetical protein
MKNLKYLMLFLVFLIISCKKNMNPFEGGINENKFYIQADWVGDLKMLKNMLEFYEQTKDSKSLIGSTLIQKDNATTNFPNVTNEGAFNSNFNFLSSNNFILSNGIQDFSLEKVNESNFATKTKLVANDIYGKKLTFKAVVNDKLNIRSEDFGTWEESIYVPKTLQITSNMKYFDNISKRNGSNLIKWIPDNNPENDKAVVIRLRYNPNVEKTTNKATNLPNNIIDKYIVVKDEGTFDVKNVHLKDFPTPLFSLQVTIFRGNFKKSQVNGKNISIVVFDSFSFFTQLKD